MGLIKHKLSLDGKATTHHQHQELFLLAALPFDGVTRAVFVTVGSVFMSKLMPSTISANILCKSSKLSPYTKYQWSVNWIIITYITF